MECISADNALGKLQKKWDSRNIVKKGKEAIYLLSRIFLLHLKFYARGNVRK